MNAIKNLCPYPERTGARPHTSSIYTISKHVVEIVSQIEKGKFFHFAIQLSQTELWKGNEILLLIKPGSISPWTF